MVDYAQEVESLRLKLLERYCLGERVIDLGCGTGSYLIPLAKITKEIVGVDFSQKSLGILRTKLNNQVRSNIQLCQGDIKDMPFEAKSFDVAYSMSTLYYVSEVERAILEIGRILKSGGVAIFELGNLWSLNTIAVRNYPTGVKSFHITPSRMKQIIRQAKFRVLEHKCFQLLPMCSGPIYLLPLVTSKWKLIMGKKVKGGMVDEIVSTLYPFRYFAFRHLFICRKEVKEVAV